MELIASLTGRPLYHACGYRDVELTTHQFPNGVEAAGYRMAKALRQDTSATRANVPPVPAVG